MTTNIEQLRKQCLAKYGEIAPDNILEFVLSAFQKPTDEDIKWAQTHDTVK